jgi:preprotein translocase subunit SecG
MRRWRNWQTHKLEVLAPQGIGVQVPSSAPIQHIFPEGFIPAMVTILVILHVLVAFFLIGVVLLQQGKSADLAAAFGGQGSQTAFGPRGAANLLTRLTTYSAIVFMLTSIGLTILLSRAGGDHSVLSGHKTTQQQSAPAPKK